MNHCLYFIYVCYQCGTTQRQTMQESLSVLYMCMLSVCNPHPQTMQESLYVLYIRMLPVCNHTATDNIWITVCTLYTYATSVEPHSDIQCMNHCLYFICVCYQCVTPHPQTMQESLYVLYICMLPVCNTTGTDNAEITVCILYTYATSV